MSFSYSNSTIRAHVPALYNRFFWLNHYRKETAQNGGTLAFQLTPAQLAISVSNASILKREELISKLFIHSIILN